MSRLAGKVALVTGGAGGIGSATCRKLADEGASVAVLDINADGAAAVATDIESAGGTAMALVVDLSSEAEIAAAISAVVERFGRLDLVHNNAALTDSGFLNRDTAVTDLDIEVWDTTLDVNLRSQMLMCKHAIPAMVANGGGSIVNMSSGAAFSGDNTRTAYGVSKAGVHALTMYAATSHGKAGVRVNTVVPGLIITEAVRAHIPEGMLGKLGRAVLTPELGRPDDIADLVVFLASDESRYITGQSITIDGGMTAHSGQSSQSDD